MTTDEASATLAKLRPMRTASYLASLLVVGNWRRITHSIKSPSGNYRTTLIPLACWLDKPSVHTIHVVGSSSLSSFAVNSATKSAKAWALIAVLGWYRMSNSLRSITYKTNCLAASRLFIALHNGLFISTTMVCA